MTTIEVEKDDFAGWHAVVFHDKVALHVTDSYPIASDAEQAARAWIDDRKEKTVPAPLGGNDPGGCPRFTAYAGTDFSYVESSDDLDELLGTLGELVSPDTEEDAVVYEGDRRIAAVVLANGAVHRFDDRPAPVNGIARRILERRKK